MSRDKIRRYLIAYDIPSDKRRTKLAKELGKYGDRLQYSVFVLDVSPASILRLKTKLLALMDSNEDSVLVCDIGLKTAVSEMNFQYLGVQRSLTDESVMIV